MFRVVNPKRALPWQEGIYCAMCLTEDQGLKYFPDFFIPETFFCETCWEKCRIQDHMVEFGLEDNPEAEN